LTNSIDFVSLVDTLLEDNDVHVFLNVVINSSHSVVQIDLDIEKMSVSLSSGCSEKKFLKRLGIRFFNGAANVAKLHLEITIK